MAQLSIIPEDLNVSNGFVQAEIFSELSDVNLKKNITYLTDTLKQVYSLSGYTYKWKKGRYSKKNKVIGFIAQEMAEVFPEVNIILIVYYPIL